MPGDQNPLSYQSSPDARRDVMSAMHRSLKTWTILWIVWAVGLLIWIAYLLLIAFVMLKLFT
jgi:hypothetical protein